MGTDTGSEIMVPIKFKVWVEKIHVYRFLAAISH